MDERFRLLQQAVHMSKMICQEQKDATGVYVVLIVL